MGGHRRAALLVAAASLLSLSVVASAALVRRDPPAQTADVRLINGCGVDLWFEARSNDDSPLPGYTETRSKVGPGGFADYTLPATGIVAAHFWAKYGCDAKGMNCAIGDQKRYWNSTAKALGGCPPSGCTPPIDTLFEITAKCKPGSSCYDANERSFWDTSHVDGWSIPYRVRGIGAASEIAKCDPGFQSGVVDASQLSGAHCPGSEDISWNGTWPSVIVGGKTISLRTVDLRYVSGGKVLGCFSPCQKVTQTPVQGGLGQSDMDGKVGTYMCCPTHVANPTPDNCKPAAGCVLPPVCRAGPVPKTGYVKAIHAYVPGSYGYSYDDGSGNHNCPPGTVVYEMTFCPPGSAAYPASLPKPTTAGPKKTTTRRKSTTKVLFGAKRSSTKRRTTTKRRSSQRRSTSRRT